MEISSIRTTGILIATKSTEKTVTIAGKSSQSQTKADQVTLAAVDSLELTTYTAGGTTSDSSATEVVSASEIDVGALRDSYREAIRERVSYLLGKIFGSDDRTAAEVLFGSAGISSTESSTLDSYYSPEETAQRIVDFAISFYSGGDRDEYVSMVKEAVSKGYSQAASAFGDTLPSAAGKTISLVMDALDEFAAEDSASV